MTAEMPFVGRLVIGYLLADSDLTGLELGDGPLGSRIYSDVPSGFVNGVRVDQLGGRIVPPTSTYWLTNVVVQVNCWGGSRHSTDRLAERCQRSLSQLSGAVTVTVGGTDERAVVSEVLLGGIHHQNDESRKPPVPWAHFDATVTAHPLST